MRSFVTLIFAVLLLGCNRSTTPPAKPVIQLSVNKLESFAGEDLQKLTPQRKAELDALFAPFQNPDPNFGVLLKEDPWHIWPYDANGRRNFLVFYGRKLGMIPGDSFATVKLFDRQGYLINSVQFSTGHRIDLLSAQWSYDHDLKCHCLNIRTSASINGNDIARRVYAIQDQQLILLWAEDSQGKTLPRRFAEQSTYPSFKKEAEFEKYLNSSNPVHVCEALWLLTNGDYEILKQPQVLARIQELSRGENPRLKTLALRVLKSIEKPPNHIERYD